MGWKFDTPEHFKSVYGVKAKDLEGQLPRTQKKQTALGGELYRETAKGFEFMPVQLGGIQLWNPIIRAVSRKTVIETPLVERNGSVKEIISTDDWILSIRGTIKNGEGVWPDLELSELLELYARNEAIPIRCALTDRLLNGSEYVVITSLSLPDKPGFVQSIDYNIECVSDIPFELELEE